MSHRIQYIVVLAIAWLAFSTTSSAAGEPPFVQGEVAVYATPDELPGQQIGRFLPHAGITVLKVASGKEWGLVQQLRAKGKRAGLNLIATASYTPNDPLLGYQWHMQSIQAPQAWGVSNGSGVTVAVLDTGLASGGPDGIGCVESGYNLVKDPNNPSSPPDPTDFIDRNGHGTHVSGTVGQATDNGVGVTGVAYGACVMPVKVLDDSGSGSFADIADGIHYAVDQGAAVINMSLGTNSHYRVTSDPIMDPALDYAYNHAVTVVAAAGNDGNRRNVSYPAIYPSVIAVGATDYRNQVTSYSNKGKGLDLMAPGGDTTRDDNGDGYGDGVLQETFYNGSWGYWFFQGTSMASPHVAGAAAVLISSGAASTPDQVVQLLENTAKDLGDPGYDKNYGYGLIQLYAALTGSVPTPPPSCTDADGDGYCADVDCNDNDPKIHPGANDTKGKAGHDGIDNDCNGIIDG